MLPKKLLIVGVISATVMVGCAKKESQKDIEFSQQSETPSMSETEDIFDEFYKSDSSTESVPSTPSTPEPVQTPKQTGNYVPQFSDNGRYVVQVSTVGPRSIADKHVSNLSAKGYPAYVAEVTNPTPELFGTFYRIRIGGFNTVSAAKDFGENALRADGYDYWVDNKSNDNVGIDGSGFGNNNDQYYSPPAPAPSATPIASEPYTEPASAAPVATEPVVTEPAVTEPAAEPVAAEPIAEPVVTEPVAAEPVAEPVPAETIVEEAPAPASGGTDFDSGLDTGLDSDWSDEEW